MLVFFLFLVLEKGNERRRFSAFAYLLQVIPSGKSNQMHIHISMFEVTFLAFFFQMYMYSGYSSYDSEIQRHLVCQSPLVSTVSLPVAEQIAKPFLEHIHELIISNRPLSLTTDKDFKWALEIFAFGFTCEESSIHQLCANIYVEWLKVFETRSATSNSIPAILREKTEFYWSQMFWHLYHLFVIHDGKTPKETNVHRSMRSVFI